MFFSFLFFSFLFLEGPVDSDDAGFIFSAVAAVVVDVVVVVVVVVYSVEIAELLNQIWQLHETDHPPKRNPKPKKKLLTNVADSVDIVLERYSL